MKTKIAIGLLLLTAALGLAAEPAPGLPPAHAAIPKFPGAGGGVDLVEQIVNAAPAAMLHKLTVPETLEEGRKELNQYFGKHVVNQPAKLRIKIEYAGAYSQGPNKYRIRAASAPLDWMGGQMGRLNYFYFYAAQIPNPAKVKVGSDAVLSGIIRRCEVVDRAGFLKINFDLTGCALVSP